MSAAALINSVGQISLTGPHQLCTKLFNRQVTKPDMVKCLAINVVGSATNLLTIVFFLQTFNTQTHMYTMCLF